MLPRHNRLPAFEVRQIMRYGIRFSSEAVTCMYRIRTTPSDTKTPVVHAPRFSFVVSVKVSKSAVVRNRVRRILRESIHHMVPTIADKVDMVIIGTKGLITLPQSDVEVRIINVLKKLGVMKYEK